MALSEEPGPPKRDCPSISLRRKSLKSSPGQPPWLNNEHRADFPIRMIRGAVLAKPAPKVLDGEVLREAGGE